MLSCTAPQFEATLTQISKNLTFYSDIPAILLNEILDLVGLHKVVVEDIHHLSHGPSCENHRIVMCCSQSWQTNTKVTESNGEMNTTVRQDSMTKIGLRFLNMFIMPEIRLSCNPLSCDALSRLSHYLRHTITDVCIVYDCCGLQVQRLSPHIHLAVLVQSTNRVTLIQLHS